MSHENTVYQISEWTKTVRKNMPHLSKPMATLLALISFAMVIVRCCGQTTISVFIAKLVNKKEETVRQQVREFYYDAQDKKGENRLSIEVETCFIHLLRWVLNSFENISFLPIALDATTLIDKFVALSVSVIYRGAAIPVAWKILKVDERHPWNPEWIRLLNLIKPSVRTDIEVLILTDRGLYSPEIFNAIKLLNWHPFMRINTGGKFCPENGIFLPLSNFAPRQGTLWSGFGVAFKKHSIACTLLAYWDYGYEDPWLILTDLPAHRAESCLYSLRSSIEQSFRNIKRGHFQWHNTKMTDPNRAIRLWLPIALATLFLLCSGTLSDKEITDNSQPMIKQSLGNRLLIKRPIRRLSVLKQGWIDTLISFLNDSPLNFGKLSHQVFPTIIPPILT
jgi:hypothetical protein